MRQEHTGLAKLKELSCFITSLFSWTHRIQETGIPQILNLPGHMISEKNKATAIILGT